MKICDDVKYVGVNDHEIDLFESQFKVPDGMSYNSYVILDDKIAVMDSVDENFGEQWLENIKNVLKNDAGGRIPDYLVVHHMEILEREVRKELTHRLTGYYQAAK